jgi:DNA-binding transcriptional LysR family regulator
VASRAAPPSWLVLLLPAGHALVPAVGAAVDLAAVLDHDLVAFARTTSLTRQLAGAAEALRRPLRIRTQVRSFDAMGRMVAAGLGLAVLPREGARPYAHALGLVIAPLAGLRTERRLLLAMRDRAALSAPAEALVRLVEQRTAGAAVR